MQIYSIIISIGSSASALIEVDYFEIVENPYLTISGNMIREKSYCTIFTSDSRNQES
jgi:hypothetical protein